MYSITKPVLLISAALLIVLIVGVGYTFNKRTPETSELTTTPTPNLTNQSSPATQDNERAPSGTYIDYKAGIIEQTSGTKILFFHAPWCPQCRKLEASIKAGTIPANTTIIKTDYDSNQALRKAYGVTLQTTLVRVDDAGNLVKKYVAYDDPSLEALIQNTL